MNTERHMLVCAACGSPIETNPGYPDIWRCPVHGAIAEAKRVKPPQEPLIGGST